MVVGERETTLQTFRGVVTRLYEAVSPSGFSNIYETTAEAV